MLPFKFNYVSHPNMAKLAWGMKISRNMQTVDVHVGPNVEIKDDFFVSGIWDGDFLEGGFDHCEFFCGTGARNITVDGESQIKVCTALHERERLCYINDSDAFYVSNSIPLLLVLTGTKLDPRFFEYERLFCSIMDGLDVYDQKIPLYGGKVMYQVFWADIIVDQTLNISIVPKEKHRPFADYEDYYSSLMHVLSQMIANGRDPNRKIRYGLVTTISSGYDSCACAAVAKDLGCDCAMTFCGDKYMVDSGVEIAKKLGYKTILERDSQIYKNQRGAVDSRYLANGEQGSNLEFLVFDDIIAENIVFDGSNGDHAFGLDTVVSDKLSRDRTFPYYQANLSYVEPSLFNGHISLVMPLYALSAYPSIHAISESQEMEPWRMHNSYDRPIPRRIVETHGVDRNLFGQEKHGGGLSFAKNFTNAQIKAKMTPDGYDDFQAWMHEKGNNPWSFNRIWNFIGYHISMIPGYLTYVNGKWFKGRLPFHHEDKRPRFVNPGIPSRLIVWGIERTKQDYQTALDKKL